MIGQPDHEPENVHSFSVDFGESSDDGTRQPEAAQNPTLAVAPLVPAENPWEGDQLAGEQPQEHPMFQNWYVPPPRPPVRIPHFGHLGILLVFILSGLFAAGILMAIAVRFHLFGVTSMQRAVADMDIRFALGSEIVVYFVMFAACLLFFPMIWHKGYFEGVHWNGMTALHLRWQLIVTAAICFVLALVNSLLLPSPKNAPIDKIFHTPGAPWWLFAFGITFAPFFEETIFRGFILPAFCTGCDWINEKFTHAPVRPLDEHGHPQWSFAAMVIGSLVTSIMFAFMHAAQTGYSLGPFILLIGVSAVLCWALLSTRSLAASVLVHASYNFLLFSIMMLGTSGFRHLDKL